MSRAHVAGLLRISDTHCMHTTRMRRRRACNVAEQLLHTQSQNVPGLYSVLCVEHERSCVPSGMSIRYGTIISMFWARSSGAHSSHVDASSHIATAATYAPCWWVCRSVPHSVAILCRRPLAGVEVLAQRVTYPDRAEQPNGAVAVSSGLRKAPDDVHWM